MSESRKRLWRCLAIALLSWPLLSTTCVDIAQRSLINGFFDAFLPYFEAGVEGQLLGSDES